MSVTTYDIELYTAIAKQLWNGRPVSTGKRFIPGVLDFHDSLCRHTSRHRDKSQVTLPSVDLEIQRTHDALQAWQQTLRQLLAPLQSVDDKVAQLGLVYETKRVCFANPTTQRLAELIALFDQTARLAITADDRRDELGLEISSRPSEPTQLFAKTIKAILHSVR